MSNFLKIKRKSTSHSGAWKYHLLKNQQYILDLCEQMEKRIGETPVKIQRNVKRQIGMLKTNSAQIRKCENCKRIVIQDRGRLKFKTNYQKRHFNCTFCNYDLQKIPRPTWFDEAKKRSDNLQLIWKDLYEAYVTRLNEGVTVIK